MRSTLRAHHTVEWREARARAAMMRTLIRHGVDDDAVVEIVDDILSGLRGDLLIPGRFLEPETDTTQETEQTTETHVEWLTIGTDEDGDVGAETFGSAAAAEKAAQRWRHWMTDVHVERHEVTTARSVSSWSPVAVHDEEQQR